MERGRPLLAFAPEDGVKRSSRRMSEGCVRGIEGRYLGRYAYGERAKAIRVDLALVRQARHELDGHVRRPQTRRVLGVVRIEREAVEMQRPRNVQAGQLS